MYLFTLHIFYFFCLEFEYEFRTELIVEISTAFFFPKKIRIIFGDKLSVIQQVFFGEFMFGLGKSVPENSEIQLWTMDKRGLSSQL